MKDYVIYTAIVGDYDEVKQPVVIDDRFDYILFTDGNKGNKREKSIGVWKLRNLGVYHNTDSVKTARFYKTHPHWLLYNQGYRFTIWIDSNIQIQDSYIYERAIELYKKGVLVSALPHPLRKCVYDEMTAVLKYGFESEKVLYDWAKFLRDKKYPLNNGLNETGLLFRNNTSYDVMLFNDLWWKCIDKYSRRDQLSFNYALKARNIDCVDFMDNDIRKSLHFLYSNHKNKYVRYVPNPYTTYLRTYSICFTDCEKEIDGVYKKIFKSRFPNLIARLYSLKYRLKARIKIMKLQIYCRKILND